MRGEREGRVGWGRGGGEIGSGGENSDRQILDISRRPDGWDGTCLWLSCAPPILLRSVWTVHLPDNW